MEKNEHNFYQNVSVKFTNTECWGKSHLTLLWGESQSTECVLQCLDLLKQLLTLVREGLDVHCSQGALKTDPIQTGLASQVIKGQPPINMA